MWHLCINSSHQAITFRMIELFEEDCKKTWIVWQRKKWVKSLKRKNMDLGDLMEKIYKEEAVEQDFEYCFLDCWKEKQRRINKESKKYWLVWNDQCIKR